MKKQILMVLLVSIMGTLQGQEYSDLWGKNGEKWNPESRLPDFSYAGYHFGEAPLPEIKAVTDVTKFGAKGDGKTDCTEAFKKAITATDKGAITIPPGRYVINDIIWIQKPGIVLRGAGPGKTILYCPKTLEDVRPNMGATTSGKPTSNYSWSGGFIWVMGKKSWRKISPIVSESKRGAKEINIKKPRIPVKKGQRVLVELEDNKNKTLIRHLYSDDPGDTKKITKPLKLRMVNRIESVDGNKVVLERPLMTDIRKSWNPILRLDEPTVSEVGIEDLSIEFPVKPYPGHTFEELGMNGIAINNAANCWIKNVQVSNSDSGIYLCGNNCTADGILLDSKRKPGQGTTGHHGVTMGQDCLIQNFDFQTHFVHDFTVSYLRHGNVVKNGRGINLSLDHHKKTPFDNLFCNIDVGKGSEIWRCGGGRALGKHCGARGTFWGIKSAKVLKPPRENFGPDSINLVGLKIKGKSIKDKKGKWIENISPEKLQPLDLHAAQVKKRLKE